MRKESGRPKKYCLTGGSLFFLGFLVRFLPRKNEQRAQNLGVKRMNLRERTPPFMAFFLGTKEKSSYLLNK